MWKLSIIHCDIEEADTQAIFAKRPFNHAKFQQLCEQLQLTENQQAQWQILIATLYPDKMNH